VYLVYRVSSSSITSLLHLEGLKLMYPKGLPEHLVLGNKLQVIENLRVSKDKQKKNFKPLCPSRTTVRITIPAGNAAGKQLRRGAGGALQYLIGIGDDAVRGGGSGASVLLTSQRARAQILITLAVVEVLNHTSGTVSCETGNDKCMLGRLCY